MSEDPNESDLLIDFNNSISSRSNALDLKTPSLLPPPCNSAINSDIRNENNNPFDVAINKTLQHASAANDPFEIVFEKASKASSENVSEAANDPFEVVFEKASKASSENIPEAANDPFEVVFEKASKASSGNIPEDKSNAETATAPCINTSIVRNCDVNNSKFSSSTSGMDLNLLKEKLAALIVETRNSANCLDAMDDNIMDITDPTGHAMLNLTDVSLQMSFIESQLASAIEESSVCQSNSKVSLLADTNELNKETLSSGKDSSSDSSFQQSKTSSKSVEEIKAMVAKRVSICIQNALEDSKRAENMSHRRALSLSSINPVLPKISSFTNDYCDAAPIKDDVKDLKTELERIKSSWKNCSYHKSTLASSLSSNNSKNTVSSEVLPAKPALNSTAPVKRLTDVPDLQDALSSQKPKILDCEMQKINDQLHFSPTTMAIVCAEALTLSEYFHKLAENSSMDSEEDDLLNSTPPWEKCTLVLPEHGSDEDDLQALACSWQKPNTGDSLDGVKKVATGSFIKESPVREKPKFQSCPTTPILTSSPRTKADSASSTASELIIAIPPSSDEKKPHLTLRSRLSAILNKNPLPSKPELPATPPVPVKVVADEEGNTEIKLRPKRKQTVEKKGPMKAVMPLDNMTRPTSATKKAAAVKMKPSSQRQPVLSSAPIQGKRSPSCSRVSNTPPASTPPAAAEGGKGRLSPSPGFGFQGAENRRFVSPKGGAVSATSTAQLQVHQSGSLPEDKRVSPKSSAPGRNVPIWQKSKTNISQIVKPACKTTVSTECQGKPSNTLPQADTSSNVVTSTPVKNQQIPKFQSSPIYHTDTKEKEARFRNSLNVDGASTGNAKSTASNVNSKKKLTHMRSRSVGSAQNKIEKSPASSENKQGPTVISGTKAPKTAANVLKPLSMLKPTNKLISKMSCSEKAKDDEKTKSTTRMMSKMRRSAGASLDKENMNPP